MLRDLILAEQWPRHTGHTPARPAESQGERLRLGLPERRNPRQRLGMLFRTRLTTDWGKKGLGQAGWPQNVKKKTVLLSRTDIRNESFFLKNENYICMFDSIKK